MLDVGTPDVACPIICITARLNCTLTSEILLLRWEFSPPLLDRFLQESPHSRDHDTFIPAAVRRICRAEYRPVRIRTEEIGWLSLASEERRSFVGEDTPTWRSLILLLEGDSLSVTSPLFKEEIWWSKIAGGCGSCPDSLQIDASH